MHPNGFSAFVLTTK